MNVNDLRKKAKQIGHFAFARYMLKQGYPFSYTYYILFNKRGVK